MSDKQTTKQVMSEEVALAEFHSFLSKWQKKPKPIDKLKEDYEDSIDALMDGRLVINAEKEPVYTLLVPVLDKKEITFKTRVKPNAKASLADGLDLQKQSAKFALRLIAHVAGVATVQELDKFDDADYDVISQLAAVFM